MSMQQRIERLARTLRPEEQIEFRKIIAWVRADAIESFCDARIASFEERMRRKAESDLYVSTPDRRIT